MLRGIETLPEAVGPPPAGASLQAGAGPAAGFLCPILG
jgi:hypothetical protein